MSDNGAGTTLSSLTSRSINFCNFEDTVRVHMASKTSLNSPPAPRIGIFWFVAETLESSRFLSFSRPWTEVREIAGFKTLDEGHVDVWPLFQRQYPFLRVYEYEAFPRGRVNWSADGDQWLLLLDPKLEGRSFISHIVKEWNLPIDRLTIMTDPHYRSSQQVGLPMEVNE
jgi:hypothetical protein